MTAVDHAELKRVAEGAIGEPWGSITSGPKLSRDEILVRVTDDRDWPVVAEHILVANPAVVLALLSEIEGLKAERDRLRTACAKQNDEIQQTLGKALGYPWFKDDQVNFPGATEADGVCVGNHVAESIADEAANRLRTQAPDSWRPDREAVARIIDPFAWRKVDKVRKHYADHITEEQRREWARDTTSIAKADAILALRPQTAESGT